MQRYEFPMDFLSVVSHLFEVGSRNASRGIEKQPIHPFPWMLRRACMTPVVKRNRSLALWLQQLMADWAYVRFVASHLPYPDVAETDGLAGVAVHLQADGTLAVLFCTGEADIFGSPQYLRMVLEHHAVVYDRHIGAVQIGAVLLEYRSRVDDVVHVPFTWPAHGIGKGRCLLVDAAGHAIDVCLVLVAVENLHFVLVLKEHAAVATTLSLAIDVGGYTPLKMELEAAKLLTGDDVALGLVHRENAVSYDPSGIASVVVAPCREVFAIEEHYGIAGGCVGGDASGGDDLGLRRPILRHAWAHGFGFWVLFFLCLHL